MTTKKWLPVRCCCQPQKIMGFVRVDDTARHHDRLIVRLAKCAGLAPLLIDYDVNEVLPTETVELELAAFIGPGTTELAIKSGDQPITWWRGVIGFVEVSG